VTDVLHSEDSLLDGAPCGFIVFTDDGTVRVVNQTLLDMLGAIVFVQMKRGFSGYELEFLLLGSSVALFLAGAGRISIDATIADRQAGRSAAP